MTKLLDSLESMAELSHPPGTPEYERTLRKLKVEQCLRMNSAGSCHECARYEHCELRVAYGFDRKYRRDDAE